MLDLDFFFANQGREEFAFVLALDAAIKQGSVWRLGYHGNMHEVRLRKDPHE